MGRRALVALALLVAGLAAPPVTRAANDDRLAAVQSVLDQRVAALRAGDRTRWLDTVDPKAPAAFRELQGREFDGLHSLPLAGYALTARLDDTGDLAPGAGLAATYGATVYLPETRQTLRFRDYDDRDEVDSLWLTFVQRDSRWYVGGDADLAPVGVDPFRGMWDFGPVATIAEPHVLVLYHPEQADRAKVLGQVTEEAMVTVAKQWDKPWPGKIPLILPGSIDELDQMLQSVVDLDKFVAFTDYDVVRDGTDFRTTAPRIFAQDRNLSKYDHAGQVQILVHELAHAAAAPLAGPFVAAWVHEGVADWEARGRSTTERRPPRSDGVLPRDYEFSTGSQTSIVLAYDESRSAVSWLAHRSGVGSPSALFDALGQPKVVPGNTDYQVDQALRKTAGLGLADLQSGWGGR